MKPFIFSLEIVDETEELIYGIVYANSMEEALVRLNNCYKNKVTVTNPKVRSIPPIPEIGEFMVITNKNLGLDNAKW